MQIRSSYNVTLKENDPTYQNSLRIMRSFKDPFIDNAGDNIAKLAGELSMEDLQVQSRLIRNSIFPEGLNDIVNRKELFPYLMPSNYLHSLTTYLDAYIVKLGLIGPRGLKKIKILEIGANCGKFAYFLQNRYDADVTGLERDRLAVIYAKNNGLNFIEGDASKMPFDNSSFNIVLSHNFICPGYTSFLYGYEANNFREKVVSEVHRVLIPNGFAIFNEIGVDELRSTDRFSIGGYLTMPRALNPTLVVQK